MHSGSNGKIALTPECRTLVTGVASTGVCASYSSSIVGGFYTASIPNCVGQRQTIRRTPEAQSSPAAGHRSIRNHFLLGINSLPRIAGIACSKGKTFAHGPVRLEQKWQRHAIFAHPSSTVFFIQNAASMAKPEV